MHHLKEEQMLYQHYNDLIQISYQRGIPVFSQFAGLNDMELCFQALQSFYGNHWQEGKHAIFYGGYPEAERKVICFLPEETGCNIDYGAFPICCIQIVPANKKFSDNLNHRDYLGAVMNLGITRNQVGDILVKREKRAVAFLAARIYFAKKIRQAFCQRLPVSATPLLKPVKWTFQKLAGSHPFQRLQAVFHHSAWIASFPLQQKYHARKALP